MNTTILALQNLYVALGGELTDTYDTIADGVAVSDYVIIPDMINAIANLNISGREGASLPSVTASDNGDVLTVVDGAWNKADAPTELPSVTADDNGKVLKVVNGAWALADDATE